MKSDVCKGQSVYQTSTQGVHGGREGMISHSPPLDFSTTYRISDLAQGARSIQDFVEGAQSSKNPVYARLYNPTVHGFEKALAQLEGAEQSVAYASGMAAITALLMAHQGHIVAVRPLYGGTDHLLGAGLLNLNVSYVHPDGVAEAIGPETTLVFMETPANPTLQLVDIEAVVRQAGDVPVAVDSTFATPVLQKPLRHGATYVVHSATKYLGGHGDAMGGIIATSGEKAGTLRQIRLLTGAVLHPMAAYLLHRGLQTLSARVLTAQETAKSLALRLEQHPMVTQVYYPGLQEWSRPLKSGQMTGPGAMISFEVAGGFEAALVLMRAVNLITPAVSLGSTETLIQHPASLTHQVVSEDGKKQGGIGDALLRVSVGLEDVEELWADMEQALLMASQLQAKSA